MIPVKPACDPGYHRQRIAPSESNAAAALCGSRAFAWLCRCGYQATGWGFTLRGDCDFQLHKLGGFTLRGDGDKLGMHAKAVR